MAAANVVYLPGLFGSELFLGPPDFPIPIKIWVSPLSVISGIVIQLQLAADGRSPGPRTDGYQIYKEQVVSEYYEPLARYMEEIGYTVRREAFDWRLTIADAAAAVALDLTTNLPNTEIVFVAHSMGGLVARAAAKILGAGGTGGPVRAIITLGTPHFGSLIPVQTWFGAARFYQRLAQAIGLLFPSSSPPRNGMLDAICATWPSLYELMSFAHSGPLFSQNPAAAAAIYESSNYAGGNPYLQSASLAAAPAAQDALVAASDPSILSCIVGSGVRTPDNLDMTRPLNSPIVYEYSDDGDGVVAANSAQVAGCQVLTVSGVPHELLPQSPQCWGAVRHFLGQVIGRAR